MRGVRAQGSQIQSFGVRGGLGGTNTLAGNVFNTGLEHGVESKPVAGVLSEHDQESGRVLGDGEEFDLQIQVRRSCLD